MSVERLKNDTHENVHETGQDLIKRSPKVNYLFVCFKTGVVGQLSGLRGIYRKSLGTMPFFTKTYLPSVQGLCPFRHVMFLQVLSSQ